MHKSLLSTGPAVTAEGVLIPHICWRAILEDMSTLAAQNETLIDVNRSLLQTIDELLSVVGHRDGRAPGDASPVPGGDDPYSLAALQRLL